MPTPSPHSEASGVKSRRSLLTALIGLIGAGITTVLGVTIGRFAMAPAFSKTTTENWIELGALAARPQRPLATFALLLILLGAVGLGALSKY
jgi:hypothetical protein